MDINQNLDQWQKKIQSLSEAGFSDREKYEFSLFLLKEPYTLTPDFLPAVCSMASSMVELFKKTRLLYLEAIKKNDTYILCLIENGVLKNREQRAMHRRVVSDIRSDVPDFFRFDMAHEKSIVEFHSGFRGLGYLRELQRKLFDASVNKRISYKSVFENLRKGGKAYYYNAEYSNGIYEFRLFLKNVLDAESYFAISYQELSELLKPWILAKKKLHKTLYMLSPRQFYEVFDYERRKHTKRNKIFRIKTMKTLCASHCAGKLNIVPTPNLLHEHKIVSALVWDHSLKNIFTDAERALFPQTFVIRKDAKYRFLDRTLSNEDVVSMASTRRAFIVKYAGLDFTLNSGGKSVYRLKNETQKNAELILCRAIQSMENDQEPWIIQAEHAQRETIQYYNAFTHCMEEKKMYRLLRPHFLYERESNSLKYLGGLVYFREIFKVHATRGAVCGVMCSAK